MSEIWMSQLWVLMIRCIKKGVMCSGVSLEEILSEAFELGYKFLEET